MAGAWHDYVAQLERVHALDCAEVKETLAAAKALVSLGRELAADLAELRERTAERVRASRALR